MAGRRERTSVLVADDHPLYRDGIVGAIRARPDLELVAEAQDGRTALAQIEERQPQVAVLDFNLPSLTGVQIAAELTNARVATRVLILSAYDESALVYDALRAGARGYITKDADRDEICNAVARVARGSTAFSPEFHDGLAEQIRSRRVDDRPRLSPREREILGLIAEGRSGPEIARHLYLSPATVKTHLANVYEKLEVSGASAAVAKALREGVLH
jgi:two-component system nitrate/nitrite response regulator NarL